MRHRVYEKLTAEEKVKCGKWIGGIVDDKPKEIASSKWTQIMDLLGNIIDPYYTIWTIGVVLSSPVRLIHYHCSYKYYQCYVIGCLLSCWILHTEFTRSIPELFLLLNSSHISSYKLQIVKNSA